MSLKITQNFSTYCCFLLAFILSAFSYGNLNAQVFFSEYAEGSSNNKYLEIYNAGDETVDLTQYAYANANGGSDGTYEYWNPFDSGAVVAPGDVYVIAHPSADPLILAEADETHSYLSNGDDGYALVFGNDSVYTLVDWIGDWNGDPGSGWDVCGVSAGTKDHTLVRKSSVTSGNSDWASSAGTNADDCEWIVLELNDWTNLGSHTMDVVSSVPGCTDAAACNYNVEATEDDLSCTYAEAGFDCAGNCLQGSLQSMVMNSHPNWNDGTYGATYTISLGDEVIASGPSDAGSWATSTDNFCLEDGCYEVAVTAGFNGYLSPLYTFEFGDESFTLGSTGFASIGENGCITACTDSTANNANFDADISDISLCTYDLVQGCTDATACNFDSDAEQDNGSCNYAAAGLDCEGNFITPSCDGEMFSYVDPDGNYASNELLEWSIPNNGTDPVTLVFNGVTENGYDYFFVTDMLDGSEISTLTGTLEGVVVIGNGNGVDITFDSDGSVNAAGASFDAYCTGFVAGCTDSVATNYNADASIEDGSCEYALVQGCTDATACNFDSDAEQDNGSCTYAAEGFDCAGNCLQGSLQSMVMNSHPNWNDGTYGATYTISLGDEVIASGPSDAGSWATSTDNFCLEDGCYEVAVTAGFNGYLSPLYTFEFGDESFTLGSTGFASIGENGCITACTDSTANNANFDADISDISLCTYDLVQGCTDATACNFDSDAEQDNGSCNYAAAGLDCEGNFITPSCDGEMFSYVDPDGNYASNELLEWSIPNNGTDPVTLVFNGVTENGYDYFFVTDMLDGSEISTLTGTLEGVVVIGNGNGVDITFDSDGSVNAAGASFDAYCTGFVAGCMDANACNYSLDATLDDESCTYANTNADCEGNCLDGFTLVQGAGGGNGSGGGNGGGSCVAIVEGCTDATASNYNAEANTNNGSCTLTITTTACNNPSSVRLTGPWWGWDPNGGPEAADNGDGTWTVELPNMTEAMEYLMVVDGVQENLIGAGDCTPITDGANYANRQWLPGDSYTLANVYGSCDDPATFECPTNFSTVTFSVNTANITVGENGMYLGGGIFGGADAHQMFDEDGDGVWTVDVELLEGTSGNYIFLNSPSNSGDWGAKENLAGLSCADGQYDDRLLLPVGSDTTLLHCFGSCENDGTCPDIFGCTDSTASNYNANANADDGSCEFLEEGESPYCDFSLTHFNIEAEIASAISLSVGNNGSNSIVVQIESLDGDPVDDLVINSSTGGYVLGTLSSVGGVFTNTMTWGSDVSTVNINVMWSKVSFGGNWMWSQSDVSINVNDTCDINVSDEPSVLGCMDETASNYNADATSDDGSCTLTITTTACNNPSSVRLTGPWWGWDPNGGPEAADNGDGTWTVELPNMTEAMEYLMVVDGVQENLIGAGDCTPITDGANYANRQWLPGDSYTLANVYGSCDDPATFECPTEISGCTDSTASNYNASAEIDNESCLYTVTFNVDMNCYDQPFVNVHWVSIWTDWGVGENNWNQMTDSDGDGIYTYTHLNDVPFGHNYKFMVDGVHENLIGAGDCAPSTDGATYANRVVSSTIEDGVFASCEDCVPVPGCTDAAACNYNVEATEDDLSCTYAEAGFDCAGNCLQGSLQSMVMNSHPNWNDGTYGATYTISLGDEVIASGPSDAGSWATSTDNFCLEDGCYEVAVTAGFNGYLSPLYTFEFGDESFTLGSTGFASIGENGCITACTDSTANNANFDADISDISLCTYDLVQGCTDATACNFDSDAEQDNGSCNYAAAGLDCEGNFITPSCDGEMFSYVDPDGNYASNELLEWSIPNNGTDPVTLVFNGVTENGYDYFFVTDMLDGSEISTLTGTLEGVVVIGNGNGVDITFDSDGSVNAAGASFDAYCTGFVAGCTDSVATNYNADASIEDGSCEYALVQGCTDATACNFDSDAEQDNGSCTYAAEGFDCAGNCLQGSLQSMVMNSHPNWNDGTYGATYTISLGDEVIASGPSDAGSWATSTDNFCLEDGCYEVAVTAGFNGYLSPLYTFEFGDESFTLGSTGFASIGENGCITACTDSTANNANFDADISDISLCTYDLVQGCTDATACNFDSDAEQDNGSCNYAAAGLDCEGNFITPSCDGEMFSYVDPDGNYASNELLEWSIPNNGTDPVTLVFNGVTENNWDFFFVTDMLDGSTIATLTGTLEGVVVIGNGNGVDVTFDSDGSVNYAGASFDAYCTGFVAGCTDSVATNYNADASIEDGSCEYALVQGCTDATACNFDSDAEQDNGSCTYAAEGFDCDGNCLEGVAVVYTPGSYANENSFTIADCDGNVVAEMSSGTDGFNECVVLPETYSVTLEDSYGDGWNQGSLAIGDDVYTILDVNGESTTDVFTTFPEGELQFNNMGCPIGCTNPLANNYDAANVVDDGSCVFCIDGEEVSELPEATLPDDVITITIETGTDWSFEISWELYNDETEEFIISSTQTYEDNETYVKTTGCLPAACYKLVTYDSWGDGWNGNGTFTITNQFGEILVPSTVMGPNSGINTEAEMVNGYGDPIQELSTYFSIGDASCSTFGCTDPAASNYDADASVDDGSCITCPDGEVDVTFSFNQENILTDEVFVYNETDTVFSVVSNELSLWEGKTELMCVPAGCYTISMGATSSEGWTDGSQLQILDDLSADYYFLDVGDGSINYSVVSIGGGECVDTNVGGCTDEAYDNYNPDATYDNGSCEFLCTSATEGAVASVEEDAETAPWSFLCSDASGNGAVVTFEELNADMIYVVADCDSAEVFSFNPNLEEVVLAAGECIYFQAVDAFSTDSVGTITASLFELPDTSLWGCMDEFACNYDELATYEPADACEYPEVGFDCDGVELADYMDVELDFTGSFNLCLDDDDYNATDVSDYPGFTWNTDGEDMAFAFAGDGNQVLASVYGYSDLTFNDGHLVIYNGNPLDGGTLVDSETYSGTEDMEFDIIFDTEDGNTYFVIVDSDNFDDCFEFDISITSLIGVGGCTDPTALNYDATVDYEDGTCEYPTWIDVTLPYVGTDLTNCGYNDDFNSSNTSSTSSYLGGEDAGFGFVGTGSPVQIDLTTTTSWTGLFVFDGDPLDTATVVAFETSSAGDESITFLAAEGISYVVVIDTWPSPNCVPSFDLNMVELIGGCTDTLALNYDSTAAFDDESCVYDFVWGCTDELACNYSDTADVDDGSCIFALEGFDCDNNFLASGCGFDNIITDSIAGPYENNMEVVFTYASDGETPVTVVFTAGETEANWDYWYVYDGIGEDAISIDNQIDVFDGDLAFSYATGSGNGITVVFDSDGSVTRDDDMVFDVYCVAQDIVGGCIDSTACNYDADADYNDGTCFYATATIDCNGECIEGETYTLNLFDSYGDGWDHGTGHVVVIDGVEYGGMDFVNGPDYSIDICLADICHEIYFVDNGQYEAECSFEVLDVDSNIIYASNFSTTVDNPGSFGDECGTFGCTDPSATNYDETVDFDNGSCEYPVSMWVELDYTTSSSTCLHANDYDATNTAYDPGFGTDFMNGDDMAFYFDGANGTVNASFVLTGPTTFTSMALFDGNPLDSTTTLLEFNQTGGSLSTGESMTFESNDSTTYYVVVDGLATWGCYDYDLSLSFTSGAFGCTDVAACNYDSLATADDGSCTYPDNDFVDCDGNCLFNVVTVTLEDADSDGTLASISVNEQVLLTGVGSVNACVDLAQCNTVTYNSNDDYFTSEAAWSVSDSSVVYASVAFGDYDNDLNEADVQLFGGACSLSGCMDSTACNYDPNAEVNYGCTYAEEGYDCDGVCLEDADLDGVCDADEISGCTDPTASNYDASATDDDESCIPCTDNSIELMSYDAFGDSWNGATFTMTDGVNTITSDGVTEYTDFASEFLCVPAGCYEVTVGGGATDYEISFTLGDLIVDAQAGTFTDISVGEMDGVAYCDIVLGCTDSLALNYDDLANVDDGSCIAVVEGCTDETALNYDSSANTDDGSCIAVLEGCTDSTAINYDETSTVDDGSCCYADIDEDGICDDDETLGCTDANADNYDPNAGLDDGSCTFCNEFSVELIGTTDASVNGGSDGNVQATGLGGSSNYDVAVFDADGVPQNPFALSAGDYIVQVTDITSSCVAEQAFTIGEPAGANPCDVVPSGLSVDNIIHNRVTFNWSATDAAPSHYMIRYRVVGSGADGWTVISAGPVNTNSWNGTSRTRYFMEPGTTYEWSIRARVLNEDLTINCQSDWSANSEYTTLPACPNLDNLSVSAEATWVTFFADAPSEEWGVWQSKGKMRELGANNYRYVIGGNDGNINGLKGNFTASTDYEWHTKAWCTGNVDEDGNSDPMYHSGWGDFSAFTTEAPCDAMPMNLTTSSNGANTAVIMSWDTPESGAPDHYFLEMTNVTTGEVYEWNDIPGTATSQTKFNQNPGDEISWRIRGACGTNGTSWATIFSQPVTYTLGGERVAADLVSGLDVYPNPSRDIFNVTFTSEEAQTMSVKVVNMIGEEIYNEELIEFVGQYTKVIDMNTQPKGVYFLEITTSTGGINKKIVLQ